MPYSVHNIAKIISFLPYLMLNKFAFNVSLGKSTRNIHDRFPRKPRVSDIMLLKKMKARKPRIIHIELPQTGKPQAALKAHYSK